MKGLAYKRVCKDPPELIENYDLAKKDDFEGWVLHHRLELDLEGNEVLHPADLKRMGMYYKRPYFELIYLPTHVHLSMHHKGKKHGIGHEVSDEHKEILSNFHKGKIVSEETRRKISIAGKGRHWKLSEETKRRISEARKGKKFPRKLQERSLILTR